MVFSKLLTIPIHFLENNNDDFDTIFDNDDIYQEIKYNEIIHLKDLSNDNNILVRLNKLINSNDGLNLIGFKMQYKNLSLVEKFMSYIIALFQILTLAFRKGKIKGIRLGLKTWEFGIPINSMLTFLGKIIYNKKTKKWEMTEILYILKDKIQLKNNLLREIKKLNKIKNIFILLTIIGGVLILKRLIKYIRQLKLYINKNLLKRRMNKLKNHSEKLSDDYKCIICITNIKNWIFKPCRHNVICRDCYYKLDKFECIICKSQILSTIELYLN